MPSVRSSLERLRRDTDLDVVLAAGGSEFAHCIHKYHQADADAKQKAAAAASHEVSDQQQQTIAVEMEIVSLDTEPPSLPAAMSWDSFTLQQQQAGVGHSLSPPLLDVDIPMHSTEDAEPMSTDDDDEVRLEQQVEPMDM